MKPGSDGRSRSGAGSGACKGGAVLLAAGFSRRFGSDKRRHRLAEGNSLLAASVALYSQAFPKLIVVLRPEDGELAEEVRATAAGSHVEIVVCTEAAEGMGRSLAAGAAAAQEWDYLFVALADMPWVNADTLQVLKQEMQQAASDGIILPVYRDRPGHPVGFGADYLPGLAALNGDEGARSLVRKAADRVIRVAVEDTGVLQDLDTPPA